MCDGVVQGMDRRRSQKFYELTRPREITDMTDCENCFYYRTANEKRPARCVAPTPPYVVRLITLSSINDDDLFAPHIDGELCALGKEK